MMIDRRLEFGAHYFYAPNLLRHEFFALKVERMQLEDKFCQSSGLYKLTPWQQGQNQDLQLERRHYHYRNHYRNHFRLIRYQYLSRKYHNQLCCQLHQQMLRQYHMEEKNHFGHEQLALPDEQPHLKRPRLQSMLNNSPAKIIYTSGSNESSSPHVPDNWNY